MPTTFKSTLVPPNNSNHPAMWFLFRGYHLLVTHDERNVDVPILTSPAELGLVPVRKQYMGYLERSDEPLHCFCGEIDNEAQPPTGFEFESLRPLYSRLDETSFWLAGRAIQIVDWDRTHQYCGRCGQLTVDHLSDRAKVCPHCGLTNFPRLAPAIIVRVLRLSNTGPEILLARAKRFPTSMFSVLAGFVEPGETLEECVQREVREEVGIAVKNIHYFGSQPWPFPHSLMVAFTADFDQGELSVDPSELAEAGWFSPETLPAIPPPPSIANRLISTWLESTPYH